MGLRGGGLLCPKPGMLSTGKASVSGLRFEPIGSESALRTPQRPLHHFHTSFFEWDRFYILESLPPCGGLR